MRNVFKSLGTVDDVENGNAVEISGLKAGTVNVLVDVSTSPAWNGTWVLQISADGVYWAQAPTTAGGVTATGTASKAYHLEGAAKQIRLIGTVHVAGSAVAALSGEELPAD
jgi:hypothetical protein